MNYKIKDISLAEEGKKKVDWAKSRMPVMNYLREMYEGSKPLEGKRIGGCLHVTKETAVLAETLRAAGANVAWCGCNPLSTQDDVAAYLANNGISVYAWRGLSQEEYYWAINEVLKTKPEITLDDGADLVFTAHKEGNENVLRYVIGGTEETTTGVHRLRAMVKEGKLKYPIIAVNDAETKWDFDNVYGTGQSAMDGILRATSTMIPGSNFVVSGYGHCGRGIASKARGMGAEVIVTEVNPIEALRAKMDGYRVMPMKEAAKIGDIFVTATGCRDVITKEHFEMMKDGAILANAGHFDVEISVKDLEEMATSKKEIRPNNTEYTLPNGKRLYLLAEGRLVNLGAAEGHPSQVMDMSFANQFLSILYLAEHGKELSPGVHEVSKEQDKLIAEIKLK
ncbi:MAG: adenosylhomocysteinase, partial [Candidatus Aenigmarchaeota archaeon]|nr:adenosylhomocysteinase [Candidatus Aenigmarchaeota archaeon]